MLQGRGRQGTEGAMTPKSLRYRPIFGNFNVLSEDFRTFAVGKDKGFEFYRKIHELAPPLLDRCHDASVMLDIVFYSLV